MSHTTHIATTTTTRETLWRVVCENGCGAYKWRNVKATAQADARKHIADTTPVESYIQRGGTDY